MFWVMNFKKSKKAIWLERYNHSVERMTQNAEIINLLAECTTEKFETTEDFNNAFQQFQQEISKNRYV